MGLWLPSLSCYLACWGGFSDDWEEPTRGPAIFFQMPPDQAGCQWDQMLISCNFNQIYSRELGQVTPIPPQL